MPADARPGYSALQIGLHWTIATLVFFQLVFGESMVAVFEAAEDGGLASPDDQRLASLHYWFGIAILALALIRIAVRAVSGAPAPLGSRLTARLATAVHMLFYVLLVVTPVLGLLGWYLGDPWAELHAYAKPVFIALITLHAGAALHHQFWIQDGTLRRMLAPRSP